MRTMTLDRPADLDRRLEPFFTREIAGIAAIDTAIAHETKPDYVVLFQGAKAGKQANVEQLATLVRMAGGVPPERGGVRALISKAQAGVAARLSTTATLQALRRGETEMVLLYADALGAAGGLVGRALRKALGRALVHTHLLTAHVAKRTGHPKEAALLPMPLGDYFAGPEARACLRCHLDRPGAESPLERRDPHPYTYICAACHAEVLAEFPADLAAQIDRWPTEVRHARVIQHAVGRPSLLNVIGRVLLPLSGLSPEIPTTAAERAMVVPAMTPVPGPATGERPGTLAIDPATGPEAEYTDRLFDARRVWRNW